MSISIYVKFDVPDQESALKLVGELSDFCESIGEEVTVETIDSANFGGSRQ